LESGNSSNDPRVLLKEERIESSQFELFKPSFSFMSYSELEETVASYPELMGKTGIPTFIADSFSFLNTRNLSYCPVHHRS
jgi:hypothetical protein